MNDIPEVQEVRFRTSVMATGRTLVTQLRASERVKLAVKSDALLVTDGGRLSCVVPLANVASLVPAAAPAAVKK